jgi:hypothetical protein
MSRREFETATAGSRIAAFRSLARKSGLDLRTVAQHAENGTLRFVIEHSDAQRELAGRMAVYDRLIALEEKREAPW